MELVSPIVEIIKSSSIPLRQHIGLLKNFQKNVEDLSERAKDLEARRMYLESVVNYFHDEDPINQIRGWIGQATEMEKEATNIEQKTTDMKKCLFCPNPIFLYSISKQAKKKAKTIAKHRQVGEFEKLTMPSLTPAVIEEAAPSIEGLSSVESTLNNVMAALGKENNKIIGVWGMGGIGKTTVVKILNNKLLGTEDFSKVIVVVVSKDADINRVQDDIAGRLGLTLKNDSSRASELSCRLKQERRFLIIFDDLWDRLDFDAVGIPSGNSLKDSKIILTTRKEIVCRKMETQINIKVDVLRDDESWRLFSEKAGDVINDHAIHDTATKVVRECAGLPLAIITVGRALRSCRDSHTWAHALAQLQQSTPDDIEDMEAKVYVPLKLSYELLRPELKPAFLFCCLYPDDHDIEIDRMVKQWMGEGFLAEAGDLEKTINKGHSWIVELKASCLLLEGKAEGFVRMHDVVRDVGIFIASKDEGCRSLVRTTVGLKRMPKELNWGEYKRVSLMRSKIDEVQGTAYCSQLLTLTLQENAELGRIDGFLEGGLKLRVLDLSSTAISQVPASLSNLVNLRVLCLRSCRLITTWDLTPLSRLGKLECLDLSDNEGLNELPRVIGELSNLKSLDLTRTPRLAVLGKGIFPKLTQLEELKMLQSFNRWGISTRMAHLLEVGSLRNLSRLLLEYAYVDDDVFTTFSDFRNVGKFYIRLSHPDYSEPSSNNLGRHSDRNIDINGNIDFQKIFSALKSSLFKWTTGLAFTGCDFNLGSIFSFGTMRLERLQYLSIVKCSKLLCLSRNEASDVSLYNLRYLELHYLPDLQIISDKEMGLLWNLMDLHVSFCDKLHSLFLRSLLEEMMELTTIKVDACWSMESLFVDREVDSGNRQGSSILQSLRTLVLSRLPSMTNIWNVGSVDSLQNLTTLSISSCKNLGLSVLSCSGLEEGLPNLVELSVVDCAKLRTIFSVVTDNRGLLPKLRKLKLDKLPRLQSVCDMGIGSQKATVVWQALEEIFVGRCPRLTELEPLRGGRKGVPVLEKIEVEERWWEGLDWGGDGSIRSQFQPLFIRQ